MKDEDGVDLVCGLEYKKIIEQCVYQVQSNQNTGC